MSYSTLNRSA